MFDVERRLMTRSHYDNGILSHTSTDNEVKCALLQSKERGDPLWETPSDSGTQRRSQASLSAGGPTKRTQPAPCISYPRDELNVALNSWERLAFEPACDHVVHVPKVTYGRCE